MEIIYEYSDPTIDDRHVFMSLNDFLMKHPHFVSFLTDGCEQYNQTITIRNIDMSYTEKVTVIISKNNKEVNLND